MRKNKTLYEKINFIFDNNQKSRLFVLLFIMILGALFDVVGVSLMVPLLSAVTTPDIIETNVLISRICTILNITSHRTFVLTCIWVMIGVFIIKDLYLIFEYNIQARFVYNNRFKTQQRLLHILINRPYEYFLNASTGELMRTVQTDAEQVYKLIMRLLSLFSESVVSLALLITIFVIDWQMTTFVALIMCIVMFFIVKVMRPKMRKAGKAYYGGYKNTNNWLLQTINGIKDIKVKSKEAVFEEYYRTAGAAQIQSERIRMVIDNIPRMLIEVVSVCSMLLVFAIEILMGRELNSLIPALGAFAMAAVKLMPSANRIISALNSISFDMSALDNICETLAASEVENSYIMSDTRSGKLRTENTGKTVLTDSIELRGIVYHYPNTEHNVLDGASMVIPVGKSIGVVGASGAGKTTAIDILLGLLAPQAGRVLADGKDIMEDYPAWLSHIGYIPQMIFMLDASVRTNVAFGVPETDISDKRVWECLEEAQLAEFVRSLPEGLDTVIGERGLRISGGQRQRIGIARALYDDPDVLIFDEATSSLDNDTESAIMEAINALHGRKTMIIIAHRLQTIGSCDMVYRVEKGKIEPEK